MSETALLKDNAKLWKEKCEVAEAHAAKLVQENDKLKKKIAKLKPLKPKKAATAKKPVKTQE